MKNPSMFRRLFNSQWPQAIFTGVTLVVIGLYIFFPSLRTNDSFYLVLQILITIFVVCLGVEYVAQRRKRFSNGAKKDKASPGQNDKIPLH